MYTAPYFALLGLLTILLSYKVVRLRRRHRIVIGDGGIPELKQAIRVFGNHTEYVPLGLIFLIGLEMIQAPVWYLHLAGGALLVGRLLHAIGLGKTVGTSPGRLFGMILTYTSLGLSSLGMIIFSLLASQP